MHISQEEDGFEKEGVVETNPESQESLVFFRMPLLTATLCEGKGWVTQGHMEGVR